MTNSFFFFVAGLHFKRRKLSFVLFFFFVFFVLFDSLTFCFPLPFLIVTHTSQGVLALIPYKFEIALRSTKVPSFRQRRQETKVQGPDLPDPSGAPCLGLHPCISTFEKGEANQSKRGLELKVHKLSETKVTFSLEVSNFS